MKPNESVFQPLHYLSHPSGVECIDVAERLSFKIGSAFKYVFRAGHKNSEKEDLRKALYFVDHSIKNFYVGEIWRPIWSTEKYEASTMGRVRLIGKEGVRSPVALRSGYLTLVMVIDGKHCCRYVHRMVAEAFLGSSKGRVVCHKNGVRSDNRLKNLRYDTMKNNLADRFHGHSNPSRKLSQKEIAEIRASKNSMAAPIIGERYGVSASTIKRIWNDVSWQEPPLRPIDLIVQCEQNLNRARIFSALWNSEYKGVSLSHLEEAKQLLQLEIDKCL